MKKRKGPPLIIRGSLTQLSWSHCKCDQAHHQYTSTYRVETRKPGKDRDMNHKFQDSRGVVTRIEIFATEQKRCVEVEMDGGGGELPVADCHLPTQRSSCAKRTVGDGVVYCICKVQFTFDFVYQ